MDLVWVEAVVFGLWEHEDLDCVSDTDADMVHWLYLRPSTG